jgi:CRISPR system Cascade subunit CasE
MTLFLSKIQLAQSPSANALAALLSPHAAEARLNAHHQLLWAAFSDGPDRTRDFLWREASGGTFIALSARPPVQTDLFAPHEVKPFAPQVSPGDRLGFVLRANATRTKRSGARVDVVMDALHAVEKPDRAARRMEIAQTEGTSWLDRQGVKAGFRLIHATVEDYAAPAFEGCRGPKKGQPRFGIIDVSGTLEVGDPAVFLGQLQKGFGRAKAFGCGLMLLRRP